MKKKQFVDIINRYHLEKSVESVSWNIEGNNLEIKFGSPEKDLIGTIRAKQIELPDVVFGIFTTSDLLTMLNGFSEEIEINVSPINKKNYNLKLTDKNLTGTFVTTEPEIIPIAPNLKSAPKFELAFKFGKEFISNFLTAFTAVQSEIVAILSDGTKADFILGYSDVNTNRIKFSVKSEDGEQLSLTKFSAAKLKSVLNVNKELVEGRCMVSSEGLMKIQIKFETGAVEYYLVGLQS